jgi:hypothetical protein
MMALGQKKYDAAVAALQPVMENPEAATWQMELAFAEAVGAMRKPGDDEREAARQALIRAKQKGAPSDDLERVVATVDPSLAAQLDLK